MKKQLTEQDIEKAPTTATAQGYHEYLRTDNVWNDNKLTAFNGVKGKDYPAKNANDKKYYVHKSVNKESKSADLYIRLSLTNQRKLVGTVFEDIVTEESKKDNQNLGNGILDEAETNKAKDVKVELLDADKSTISKLYKTDDTGAVIYEQDGSLPNAETTSKEDGTFEFEGVVPGYYYIRFTYSDGTSKIMPANEVIKSRDYRSTIINTADNNSLIKNAMEAENTAISDAQQKLVKNYSDENAKKLVEWYKYLGDKKYSTAVDDIETRQKISTYEYRDDGKAYKDGQEVKDNGQISAYTPIFGISIENDINNESSEGAGAEHKVEYNQFNFGLIKQTPTVTKLEKKITNVNFTNQVGANIVSANPIDLTSKYLTALDTIQVENGSKNVRLEIEPESIYGSSIELTYDISVENKTAKDYIEENDKDLGTYYKYGIIVANAKLKEITVNEVKDILDEKFNPESVNKKSGTEKIKLEEVKNSNETRIENNSTTVDEDENTVSKSYIKITGWESLASGEKESMSYTVASLLSSENDDTKYSNDAKITSLSLDKLTTLQSNYEWNTENTVFAITPTTGANRSYTELIVGIVALVVAACGFIAIKKKVI